MSPTPRAALASGMALAMLLAAGAAAQPVVAPTGGAAPGRGALAGIRRVQRLVLDGGALANLRRRTQTVVPDFPLGASRRADLVLTRFEPFAPGARAEVTGPGGPRPLPLPDQVYFSGEVAGEPGSRVLLIAGRRRVHGFVVAGGDVYRFGPDGTVGHRIYALSDVDPQVYPPPGDFCANDLVPEALTPPGRAALVVPPPLAGDPLLKQADIAIETDRELRLSFGSDAAALDYLASVAAAATAVYERDVFVRLRFSYIRLWGAAPADPWTATSTSGTLSELRAYWNDAANGMAATAGPRTVVHMISGKSVSGGIAYLNVLCNAGFGYGVSQVNGSFNLANPSQIWDIMVVMHELGHNFGSPHTHCYSPPVDQCYNGESGCYSGSVVASRGTIMSYCHLLAGGLSNIDLLFGATVSDRIAQSVAAASCLTTVSDTTTTTTTSTSTTASTGASTSTTSTSSSSSSTTTSSSSSSAAPTSSSTSSSTTTSSSTSASSTTASSATSTSSTTSSSAPAPASTSTSSPTTTLPPASGADGDGDGVPNASDACTGSPAGDLVDARGCSVCPCTASPTGGAWGSRGAYVRCVRVEARRRLALGALDRHGLRTTLRRARHAACGHATLTRCCLTVGAATRCRVERAATCAAQVAAGRAADLGPGSCLPSPCPPSPAQPSSSS